MIGFGERSWRYSMLVEDNKITKLLKFQSDYPEWKQVYNLKETITEIFNSNN